jgi:hypothetical protein
MSTRKKSNLIPGFVHTGPIFGKGSAPTPWLSETVIVRTRYFYVNRKYFQRAYYNFDILIIPIMLSKEKIKGWFSSGKVILATIATIITVSITVYNQFKRKSLTEVSGFVSSASEAVVPVDAVVKIISPIQGQTETDSKGKFMFKLEDMRSDTLLLLIQNKKTNMEIKQNEYVSVGTGRKDIFVLFNPGIDNRTIYYQLGKSNASSPAKRAPDIINAFKKTFHIRKRR